jgi:pyruvate carboxylase
MKKKSIKRLLIANRGEIATRIARACYELGITTVGIYTFEDRFSLHRYKTDESYRIGVKGDPLRPYLDIDKIVSIAIEKKVDAIHPGYGLLSENADFCQRCRDAGITFIGPSPKVLRLFGDKTAARRTAKEAGLCTIQGTMTAIDSLDSAVNIASELGYPVIVKSTIGGGGKGIRLANSFADLKEAYSRVKTEAMKSFGSSGVYIEKFISNAKHIEVQILGDRHGNCVHLFERDCSIQRRHQKVIEVAPCQVIREETRLKLCDEALRISQHVGYEGLGTVEFLVDEKENTYFLEVNPRIQVEHTVTEMITGIDLCQASILVAAGEKLNHSCIGIKDQSSISIRGTAIQCRITTEDPRKNFAPDTGQIMAYRTAGGFGVRLDEGHGTSGGIVTPHYDSLLVKVTAWGPSLESAAAKMYRSLSEFRIRGVRHNISLLKKVICDSKFLAGDYCTDFFQQNPDLFKYEEPRDRATKILRFIADVTINDPHKLYDKKASIVSNVVELKPPKNLLDTSCGKQENAKSVFDRGGVSELVSWVKKSSQLLLTDTTMRDAHQSLFATRLRTHDILKAAEYYRLTCYKFFSLEVWGGATFDTCLRFLKEDPWQRLAKIRKAIPNILLQMLLRGDNAVGYSSYPSWVIRDFISKSHEYGIDIFRVFDCLNQPTKMSLAIEQVRQVGAVAEASICYTGDICQPQKSSPYTLEYYVDLAKKLENMGVHIIAIKDMAGLLKPAAAELLIKSIKEETTLPIHLHTHDISGTGVAMLVSAARAGCDIVDGAFASMAGLTSQPSINAVIASLENSDLDPGISIDVCDEISRFWEQVRRMYEVFDPGLRATSTEVYKHEIPGGQFSNLYQQARQVGLSADEFHSLTCRYREVNQLFGNIIKVTPSSKVVGDMALLLHKNGITGEQLLKEKPSLDYPDSVVGFCEGNLGLPIGGIPDNIKQIVLGKHTNKASRVSASCQYQSKIEAQEDLSKKLQYSASITDTLSYCLYPRVFLDYIEHNKKYGSVENLATPVFFFGIQQGAELEYDLDTGKTLYISLEGMSEASQSGQRKVFFKLNGFSRIIHVQDESFKSSSHENKPHADDKNPCHITSSMPGKVLQVFVVEGEHVKEGDKILLVESMKMECLLTAKKSGSIKKIWATAGAMIESGELLCELTLVL